MSLVRKLLLLALFAPLPATLMASDCEFEGFVQDDGFDFDVDDDGFDFDD